MHKYISHHFVKKCLSLILVLVLAIPIAACNNRTEVDDYQRYRATFLDTFDTVVQVIGYTKSEEEFNEYSNYIHKEFQRMHKLFDKYNDYHGINNIKTINDFAGNSPVLVNDDLLDLLIFSKSMHEKTNGKLNIAAGALIQVWDETMETALVDPTQSKLPTDEQLQAAVPLIDINHLIIDSTNNTVFLEKAGMMLDVGALGKGYAAEVVGNQLIEMGFRSGVIISGGNWKVLGPPKEIDRNEWRVAIQNPEEPYAVGEEGVLFRIGTDKLSIDSSGDYIRYAMIDEVRVHHIIDPNTLMPGNIHRGVTVLAENGLVADYLSTELYLISYEEGLQLLKDFDANIHALWVLHDGTIKMTPGMQEVIIQ